MCVEVGESIEGSGSGMLYVLTACSLEVLRELWKLGRYSRYSGHEYVAGVLTATMLRLVIGFNPAVSPLRRANRNVVFHQVG
jgi:hypothetical protein